MRLTAGVILRVTVPATTMRSDCRGDGRYRMPKRSRSHREAPAAIISMAQRARPKVTGQMDDRRAQLVEKIDRGRDDAAGQLAFYTHFNAPFFQM